MHNRRVLTLIIIWTSCLFLLTSCVTPGKDMMPTDTGPTMTDIYHKQTGSNAVDSSHDLSLTAASLNAPAQLSDASIVTNSEYTMNAEGHVNQLFKLLPNPTIGVYIFPHMTQLHHTDVPVPGYTTAFFLYEKNHYATLPSFNVKFGFKIFVNFKRSLLLLIYK